MTSVDEYLASIPEDEDRPLHWRIKWWWRNKHPYGLRRGLRYAWQRVDRGWDDASVWSLDYHLSRKLGAQLLHLADNLHGWPGDHICTFDEWQAAIREAGNALLAYAADEDEGEREYADAKAAMHWVADHLGHLWD